MPSGLLEQMLGVLGIVAIRRQRRSGPRLRKDVGDGELIERVENGLLDALPVDGLGNRTANARVRQLRPADVDSQMTPVGNQASRNGDSVDAGKARDSIGVHVRIDVDLMRRKLVEERVDVRNDFPDEFLELRRAAEVARVWHENERRPVIPFLERIGTAGKRTLVERGGIE